MLLCLRAHTKLALAHAAAREIYCALFVLRWVGAAGWLQLCSARLESSTAKHSPETLFCAGLVARLAAAAKQEEEEEERKADWSAHNGAHTLPCVARPH